VSENDFRASRLFVGASLAAGQVVDLADSEAHYLVDVLRMAPGDLVHVFNGRHGEWRASLTQAAKRRWQLHPLSQTRAQPEPPDLHYLFAPLKHVRLDYMVQKAVEMGAGRLRPVLTRHGQVTRLNAERMRANAIEAAEQCGILSIPLIDPVADLGDVLSAWARDESRRRIVFCDEGSPEDDPVPLLTPLAGMPLALLIGPEGGFAEAERAELRRLPFVTPIPLGPRILRADTAAVAALALVQAVAGDWRGSPPGSR
jgi:16S rRNA (uracil1498-N3)-methyltransferase